MTYLRTIACFFVFVSGIIFSAADAQTISSFDDIRRPITWGRLADFCNPDLEHPERQTVASASCIAVIQTVVDTDIQNTATRGEGSRYCFPTGIRYGDIAQRYVHDAEDWVAQKSLRDGRMPELAVEVLRGVLANSYPCPSDPPPG